MSLKPSVTAAALSAIQGTRVKVKREANSMSNIKADAVDRLTVT